MMPAVGDAATAANSLDDMQMHSNPLQDTLQLAAQAAQLCSETIALHSPKSLCIRLAGHACAQFTGSMLLQHTAAAATRAAAPQHNPACTAGQKSATSTMR
jgi:hypothetical protein